MPSKTLAAASALACIAGFCVPAAAEQKKVAVGPEATSANKPLASAADQPANTKPWCGVPAALAFDTVEKAKMFVSNKQTPEYYLARDSNYVYVRSIDRSVGLDVTNQSDDFRKTSFSLIKGARIVDPKDTLYRLASPSEKQIAAALHTTMLGQTQPPTWRAVNDKALKLIGISSDPQKKIPSARKLTVAVLDTGIDKHAEFERKLSATAPATQTLLRWFEVDEEFRKKQCGGDVCCELPKADYGSSHGTQVAGLISAADNGIGISGVGEAQSVVSIRIPEISEQCYSRPALEAGVDCAIHKGAKIINISFQSDINSRRPDELIESLEDTGDETQTRDIHRMRPLVVVAAGNGGTNLSVNNVWPASVQLDWVLPVEATDLTGKRILDSNYKDETVIAAPAPMDNRLCSTAAGDPTAVSPGNCPAGYSHIQQTSAAAALVSGGATLVWGHPNYVNCTAVQVRNVLMSEAKKVDNNGIHGKKDKSTCLLQLGFLYKTVPKDGGFADLCEKIPTDRKLECEEKP